MRLITGMQCYQELVYMLDLLLAYDRFELLLRKRINNDEGQHAARGDGGRTVATELSIARHLAADVLDLGQGAV